MNVSKSKVWVTARQDWEIYVIGERNRLEILTSNFKSLEKVKEEYYHTTKDKKWKNKNKKVVVQKKRLKVKILIETI